MSTNFRIWKIDPFGPSKEDSDTGAIFSGLSEMIKIFTSVAEKPEKQIVPSEDGSNLNELQEAAYDELWHWLREESYNDEYEVYRAPYFVNEAHEKWKKINRKE